MRKSIKASHILAPDRQYNISHTNNASVLSTVQQKGLYIHLPGNLKSESQSMKKTTKSSMQMESFVLSAVIKGNRHNPRASMFPFESFLIIDIRWILAIPQPERPDLQSFKYPNIRSQLH